MHERGWADLRGGLRPLMTLVAKPNKDLREDNMMNQASGFWPIFGPLGAHGGPRAPWDGLRLER